MSILPIVSGVFAFSWPPLSDRDFWADIQLTVSVEVVAQDFERAVDLFAQTILQDVKGCLGSDRLLLRQVTIDCPLGYEQVPNTLSCKHCETLALSTAPARSSVREKLAIVTRHIRYLPCPRYHAYDQGEASW